MAVNNGIITPPIADKDPYVCMGVGMYNGWWDVGYICSNQHKKINPWSKHKPVWYPSVSVAIETAYSAKYSGHQEEPGGGYHSDGDCGVSPEGIVVDGNYDDQGGRANLIKMASVLNWEYAAPQGKDFLTSTGISACPYRLNDFSGYNHYAIPFLYLGKSSQNKDVNVASSRTLSYNLEWVESGDSTGSLGIEDVSNALRIDLKKCYLYGVVYNYAGALHQMVDSSDPIVDSDGYINGNTVVFDFVGAPTSNNWKVYLCLRYVSDTQGIFFVPIPQINGLTTVFPAVLNLINDPVGAGAGIVDPNTDIWLSPWFVNGSSLNTNTHWRLFGDATEGSNELYYMQNTDYAFSMKVKITNGSSKSTTIPAYQFTLTTNKANNKRADSVYDASWNNLYNGNVVVPANGSVTIVFCWNNVLDSSTAIYGGTEFVFKKDGNVWASATLLQKNGTTGWYNV